MQDRERTPDAAPRTDATAAAEADALRARIVELEGQLNNALSALRASEAQCADALADARRLQDISIELVRETGVDVLHERILDAAMAIMDAQFGSMQLLHPDRGEDGELELLTHRGFTAEAAEHWQWVDARSLGSCGRALQAGERAFIADVDSCSQLAGSDDLDVFRRTGIRSVQTTPLRARNGRMLGMLSTHWNRPHVPTDTELALIDALARQAADLIERWQGETILRQAAGRDTFRLALTDALRTLSDPVEVQSVATRLLAEHLDVDRALYGEVAADGDTVVVDVDACRRGAASVAGVHSIRAYGDYASEALLQGRALVEPDVVRQARVGDDERARHLAIGARAHINIPLFKAARLAAVVSVHQAAPREWSADEVTMVGEVAERVWTAVQRVRAEHALHEQGELLQSVFAAAPIGVYTIDADFRVVMVNAVARPVFARVGEAVEGRDFADVVRQVRMDGTADEIIRLFRHTLDTGEPCLVPEHARPHPDSGAIEYFEWRVDRIVMPDGRFGVVCFFRDISAQVRARRMVEDSRDALREADRRKDEFLATLAHELRNPLAPLRNGLYVLRMRDASPDPQELQIREVMERQVDVMVRLVDDLLEVSRITRGKIELRRRPVALEDVVAAALETSGPLLQQAGHALEVALPDAPVVLDVDPVRLAQVLGNLLNNAIKYTPAPGRITLRARTLDGMVEITVEDNGIGLSPELHAHVFDMFSQGDHTQAQGGLGIGLTLVRSLVELHGGSVEARSDGAGRGSAFVVRLPLPARVGPIATGADVQVPRQQRQAVLVVDDNRANADSLATLLRLAGNQVRTAYDGESCLAEIAKGLPDVVLLDLGMPHVDGYEVCRRIRALPGGDRIAVLATTGWGQQADRIRSQESGFDAHLVKPVDPVALQVEMELARRARA